MTRRILLADDHASIRRSLRALMAQRQDLEVCAEAEDGIDAVKKVKSYCPDLAVLDLAMGGLNGVEAAEEICARSPSVIVVAISMYDAAPLFPRLQEIGVRGFVSKNNLATDLLPAIDAVLTGQHWFPTERSWWSARIPSRSVL